MPVFVRRFLQSLGQFWSPEPTPIPPSPQWYTVFCEANSDAIAILRCRDQTLTLVNPAFCTLTGYPAAELVQRRPQDYQLYADGAEAQALLTQVQQIGRVDNVEFRWRTRARRLRCSLLSAWTVDLYGEWSIVLSARDISDRKAAELELTKRFHGLNSHIENSPLAALESDTDQRIQRWSKQAEKLFGWSAQEVIGQGWLVSRTVYFEDRDAVNAVMQELITGQVQQNVCTNRNYTRDGRVLEMEWYNSVLTDDAGNFISILSLGLEVTARNQAIAALEQSQAELKLITDSVPAGIAYVDASRRYRFVNRQYELWFQCDRHHLMGRYVWDVIGHHAYNLICSYIDRALQGEWVEFQINLPLHQEQERYIESRCVPNVDPYTQTVKGYYVLTTDISALKRAEFERWEANQRLEEIVHTISQLFFVQSTTTGEFLYVSPAYETIFGRSCQSLYTASETWIEAIHPEDLHQYQPLLNSANQVTFSQQEYRIIRPDGSTRWLYVEMAQIYSEIDEETRLVGFADDITDRKAAELAIQAQRRLLRQIIDTIPSLISVRDRQGRFVVLNQAAATFHGSTPEQLVGRFEHETNPHILPTWIEKITAQNKQIIDGDQPHYIPDELLLDHQGTPHWFTTSLNSICLDSDQPTGIVISSIDITDRKFIETALKESENRVRAILKAIPDMILLVSQNGIYVEVIRSTSFLDLIPDHIDPIGRLIQDFTPPHLQAKQQQAIQTALATGHIQIYEQQLFINDIEQFEEVRVVPFTQDIALLLIRDITDRKQVELAFRESEERFRQAFNYAPVGMVLIDLDGYFIQVNKAFTDLVGYSAEQLLAQSNLQLIDDLDQAIFRQTLKSLIPAELTNYDQFEIRYRHQRGHTLWVRTNISLVRDLVGTPLYFIQQVQDITERRTVDLLKSEFISIVSHELRTPLTAIHGSLGLLAAGVYDTNVEQAQRMIAIAAKDCDRLVRLVNDILDLERLESNQTARHKKWCTVSDLLQQVVDSLTAIAAKESIEILIASTLETGIYIDEDAIIQTLTNLMSNAIKFSPPRTQITVSATITMADSPNTTSSSLAPIPMVKFAVQDQGIGIPPDYVEKIFERFQQVDMQDGRQRGGTGLGLSICRTIVQQHGGQIWVDSHLGQGSTFYFTIPQAATT